MTTRIVLARHGETAWNREEVFRGRADVPLNETGRRQAQALAAAANRYEPTAVYASPLSRAAETAQAAAERGRLAVRTLPALVDIDCGRWEGRSLAEIRRDEAEDYQVWVSAPDRFSFPGGESLAQVRDRAAPALVDLARRHDGETILVVAHRVVNKVLLCEALQAGLARFWRVVQSNACLNVLAHGVHGFAVLLMNDTCHLTGLDTAPLTADF